MTLLRPRTIIAGMPLLPLQALDSYGCVVPVVWRARQAAASAGHRPTQNADCISSERPAVNLCRRCCACRHLTTTALQWALEGQWRAWCSTGAPAYNIATIRGAEVAIPQELVRGDIAEPWPCALRLV